jgi:hypothetical protein
MKVDNTILYPIIYKASLLFEDEFWQDLFKDLSYGKYPKSLYISNGILFPSNKKKVFSYSLNPEGKNVEEVASELQELIMTYTNLCSDIDTNNKKALALLKCGQINNSKWSSIKKINLQKQYILNYSTRMRKKYKLSCGSTSHLLILINSAFKDFKTHKSDDVDFENNKINEIKDIVYVEEYKSFINKRLLNSEFQWSDDSYIKTKIYIHYYWQKYILNATKAT